MAKEILEFRTEIKKVLDLLIHSVYSNKEIFLRELVSNASDAIDRARFLALTDRNIASPDEKWKIKLVVDREARTLTVSDNGIGMSREEAIRELGTIAHSGTLEFLNYIRKKKESGAEGLSSILEKKPSPGGMDGKKPDESNDGEFRELANTGVEGENFIGQFGVGFYSSFMVAERVVVTSRKRGGNYPSIKWESAADGTFSVEEIEERDYGTSVTLYLRKGEERFLDEWELRGIIRKYSDYIEHPVVIDVEKEVEDPENKNKKIKTIVEETLNSRKAIWLKNKTEVTEEEYNDFYRQISHDFEPPLKTIHYRAEGSAEFSALLYIPSRAPFDLFYKDFKIGPALYVKRVQIMPHCEELVPVWLRFIKGVVDSADLPLNVSREMLQHDRRLEMIRKNITKKILSVLSDMRKNEYDKYVRFYSEFGRVLKEGIHYEWSRKEEIADLLLVKTMLGEPGKYSTLEEYVSRMKEDQKEIYYIILTGDEDAASSPYLEIFREKGYDVVIFTDEIDDIIIGSLHEYRGRKFRSVIKGDIELEAISDETKKKYEKLVSFVKETLGDEIKDVRLSGRLKESPCCLVSGEHAIDPHLLKLMKSIGKGEGMDDRRILELNPAHPLIVKINDMISADQKASKLKDYINLLYESAKILEGSKPKDPVKFVKLVTEHMAAV